MDKPLAQVVRDYIARIVGSVPGMKALVLDAETTGIVSLVYTQSQILQQEVFLIDTLHAPHTDRMPHLKAVYFVRPTPDNVRRICTALRDTRYGEYHIFFTNIARENVISQLAEADEHEVVQQVQEMYGDYLAVNPELFSLNVPSVVGLRGTNFDQPLFDRVYQGLVALLLSLKLRPTIRYQANSDLTEQIAQKVASTIEGEAELFAFRPKEVPPLLLIVDRREDAVTPLLNQWTYQAMVHELMGISNSRVDMSTVPGVKDELKEVVLAPESDPFYAQNMFLNFGDLGANVKAMVDEYQAKTHSHRKIDSIADMQAFVENYPEFRKMSGNVSKHVALMSELSRIVDARHLMEVSQIEQELACTEDHQSAVQEVESLIGNKAVTPADKLRLVLLYALRYENNEANALHRFVDLLQSNGVSSDRLKLLPALLQQCGAGARQNDLFSNKSFFAVAKKSLQRGIKGVQNVYTQHQPYLAQTLESLSKNKLAVRARACVVRVLTCAPTAHGARRPLIPAARAPPDTARPARRSRTTRTWRATASCPSRTGVGRHRRSSCSLLAVRATRALPRARARCAAVPPLTAQSSRPVARALARPPRRRDVRGGEVRGPVQRAESGGRGSRCVEQRGRHAAHARHTRRHDGARLSLLPGRRRGLWVGWRRGEA